jgi:hypothetical protein
MYLLISFLTSLIVLVVIENSQHYANKLSAKAASENTIEPISQVSLKNDGTIMVNGKPFFPIGLYHNSQASPDWSTTGIRRLNDLKEIAKAGFNTIHPEIGGNEANDKLFLEQALKLGVYVLPNFSYDNRIDIINKYKDNPVILGWDIADDVDHPNNEFTPNEILGWHRAVKQIDNNHLTYISGAFLTRIRAFLHSADILGFQSYPIGNDPSDKNPLRNNYYTYYTLLAETLNSHVNFPEITLRKPTIIANLQAFPWQYRIPSFHEIRNMTYSALINGSKGIIFYTYFSNGWELSQNTDLWKGMKSLVDEIKELSVIFLEGKLTRIDTKIDNLYAGKWIYQDSIYLIVLSTFPKEVVNVSINILDTIEGAVQPLFPEQPSGMQLQNGMLEGIIKPGDVHVYQLFKSKRGD